MKCIVCFFVFHLLISPFLQAEKECKLAYIDRNKQFVYNGEMAPRFFDVDSNSFSRIVKIGHTGYFISDRTLPDKRIERVFYAVNPDFNKGFVLCRQEIFYNENFDSIVEYRNNRIVMTSLLDNQYYSPEIEVTKLIYYYRQMFDVYSRFLIKSDFFSVVISDENNHASIIPLKYMTYRDGAYCLFPIFSTNGNFAVYVKKTSHNSSNSYDFDKYARCIIYAIDLKNKRIVNSCYTTKDTEYAMLNEDTRELLIVSHAKEDRLRKISILNLNSMKITFEVLGYAAGWL